MPSSLSRQKLDTKRMTPPLLYLTTNFLEKVIVFNKIIQDLENINRLEDTIIYVDNARRYFPDEN